jgi:hypothetical protein
MAFDEISKTKSDNIEKDFFYSIMSIYLLNNEQLFLDFLKRQRITIPTNSQIKNYAQVKILNDYIKRLEDEEQDLNLIPESFEEHKKEEYKKILAQTYLKPEKTIVRVRENETFYWEYRANNLFIRFDAQTHEIKNIEVLTSIGNLSISSRNYEELSNGFKFPKFLKFDLPDGTSYKISLEKLIIYDDNGSKFNRALQRALKELESSTSNKNLSLNRLTI